VNTTIEMGLKFKACKKWVWMDGMQLIDTSTGVACSRLALDAKGRLYLPIGPALWEDECVPNVADPATFGIILGLLETSGEIPDVVTVDKRPSGIWEVKRVYSRKTLGEGPTRFEAVLSAFRGGTETSSLVGFEFPAADGGGYGIRVLAADGGCLTVVPINWASMEVTGEPYKIDDFKASYRYDLRRGRKSES
jgi:hypothetical protein